MVFTAIIIGFIYGYISVKGQFCMNSGFSNVTRKKDTTKLKSYVVAILIQIALLPLLFILIYFFQPENSFVNQIQFPPLFLIGTALGSFLFGIFMYYSGGCAAGIFYKIGEKNVASIFAVIGFILGIYLIQNGFLAFIREAAQGDIIFNQQMPWELPVSETLLFSMAIAISVIAVGILYLLLKREDKRPGGAIWGWKKDWFSYWFFGHSGLVFSIVFRFILWNVYYPRCVRYGQCFNFLGFITCPWYSIWRLLEC